MKKDYYKNIISDMERAYDSVTDTLKYHINWLEKKIAELYDENEKLRASADPLQQEIDEYNHLEAQTNMNLEDELVQAKAEIQALTARNRELEEVIRASKKTRTPKIKVLNCVDCKKYFKAKSRNAKRCADCRRKHINELNRKYQEGKK